MTPEAVLAEIEGKYGPGIDGYPSASTQPDYKGTHYVTICGSGVKPEGEKAKGGRDTIDGAAGVFLDAVHTYAAENRKDGDRLVWRRRPELRTWDGLHYIRARLCFEASH